MVLSILFTFAVLLICSFAMILMGDTLDLKHKLLACSPAALFLGVVWYITLTLQSIQPILA